MKKLLLVVTAILLSIFSSSIIPAVSVYAATPETDTGVTVQTLPSTENEVTTETAPQSQPDVAPLFVQAQSFNQQSHQIPDPECVDATKASNIEWEWIGKDKINVWTKDDKKVCEDTTLFFTSYVMPDSWNGVGFNSSAVPQQKFDSDSVTFTAGSHYTRGDSAQLEVNLPNECKNSQIDLYYRPEITNLDIHGHGSQYLTHQFQYRSSEGCQPEKPTVFVKVTPCTLVKTTDQVTVTVTNTTDDTMNPAIYTVTIGGKSSQITLADGASGDLTFTGLSEGTYSASVTGSDGTSVTSSEFTVNYCEPPVVTSCSEVLGTANLTKDDFITARSGTRATGHYEFTTTGLSIRTEGATNTDKVAEYWAVNKPLQQIGTPVLDYTNNGGGAPGLQLVVDFKNNGSDHDGILVGESSAYGNDWWLSNGSQQFVKDSAPSHTGGYGSTNHGTLNQWLAAFPEAKVLAGGFSLGSGVKGDGVINSITIGCTVYTFSKAVAPPVIPPVIPPTTPGQILGTSTTVPQISNAALPARLPATGAGESSATLLIAIFSAIATYGAVYFLQGKRELDV